MLNKTILFDTSRVDEELIMDRIIESLPSDNDDNIRQPQIKMSSISSTNQEKTHFF